MKTLDKTPHEITRARNYAIEMHHGQVRKYTGLPYYTHPEEVAAIVQHYGGDTSMIAAAWLHDVVEDTPATYADIYNTFGYSIAHLVWWLTDISKPTDGNREVRKAIDRRHISGAPKEAQTIKLADLVSNTISIVHHDPGFAKVYLREKLLMLEVLRKGDTYLWCMAWEIAEAGLRKIDANGV